MSKSVGVSIIVERAVFHEVGSSVDRNYLKCSDIEAPLDQSTKNFLQEKLQWVFAKNSIPARRNGEGAVAHLLQLTDENFVGVSQQLAELLQKQQHHNASPGVFGLVNFSHASGCGHALLKMEKNSALGMEWRNEEGRETYAMKSVGGLVLSKEKKLFKVAIVLSASKASEESIRVWDTQNQGVASYFLESFLGCAYLREPGYLTKLYYEAVQQFVSHSVEAARRLEVMNALIADLRSNRDEIDPEQFSLDHLRASERGPYHDSLLEYAQISSAFPKNAAQVQKQVSTHKVQFTSKVILTYPVDADVKLEKNGEYYEVSIPGDIDCVK